MILQRDFNELLALLNERGVEYAIVGGYALALHGVPRFTGDLDVLVQPSPENAQRVVDVLDAFGFGELAFSVDDFTDPDTVVQLGRPPVRIDILTGITGVSWEAVACNRISVKCDDLVVQCIGRDELIQNKKATGRARDLADLEALDSES